MADCADHRHPQHRDRAAERLVAEGPEIGEAAAAPGDDDRLHLRPCRQVLDRGGDRRRGAAILHRREGPDDRPRPAAPTQPGEQVATRRPRLRRDDADRLRQEGTRKLVLQLEETLGTKLLAKRLKPGEKIALAGEADMSRAEEEAGRCLGTAPVVVGTAADHDLSAIAEPVLGKLQLLQLVEPDRTRDRALRVAQLEIGLGLAAAEAGHLADQRHPRAPSHLFLQLAGVAANRERAGQVGSSPEGGRASRYRLAVHSVGYPVRRQRWAQAFSSTIAGRSSAPASVSE